MKNNTKEYLSHEKDYNTPKGKYLNFSSEKVNPDDRIENYVKFKSLYSL
jgi:hypothetical protein